MRTDQISKQLESGTLRYSNCWEDAETLIKAMAVKQGEAVLSIGSAGDNCFSLLCSEPSLVVAADINHSQIALIELKKAAISIFDRERTIAFLGFRASTQRLQDYEILRKQLSARSAEFWDRNKG